MRGIVCGLGQVGYRICMLALQSGHEVTVVALDARPEWMREASAAGAVFVMGDARDEKLLVTAGLDSADWLISATANDLTNIEIALDAKRLHPTVRTVARVFDQNLAPRLQSTFGIDRVHTMSRLAAPAFISAAFGDQMVASFEWGSERFGVVRVQVTESHEFAGKNLGEVRRETSLAPLLYTPMNGSPVVNPSPDTALKLGDTIKLVGRESAILSIGNPNYRPKERPVSNELRRPKRRSFRRVWRDAPRDLRALLLGLLTLIMLSTIVFKLGLGLSPVDAFYFVVTTVTTTGYGDITPKDGSTWMKLFSCLVMLLGSAAVATLYSIITDALVSARIRELTTGPPVPEEGHVIVVGLGNVGFRTCEELLRLGYDPVGIDLDPDAKFASTLKVQIPVILGDAREQEILQQANFEKASAIIVATSDDAVNLSVGLLAREEGGGQRVVLRMFDDRFAGKVQTAVAFHGAFSASAIAAPTFLGSAAHPDSVASFLARGMLVTLVARQASDLDGAQARGETIVLSLENGQVLSAIVTPLRLRHD